MSLVMSVCEGVCVREVTAARRLMRVDLQTPDTSIYPPFVFAHEAKKR